MAKKKPHKATKSKPSKRKAGKARNVKKSRLGRHKKIKKRKPSLYRKKPTGRAKSTYNVSGTTKYRAITRSIRDYYKEKGITKSKKEQLELYHSLKEQAKDIPVNRIEDFVGVTLSQGEKRRIPERMRAFDWFEFEDRFASSEAVLYFQGKGAIISLDNSAAGMDIIEFEYNDWPVYWEDIKPELRRWANEQDDSTPPMYYYTGQVGDVYSWSLNVISMEVEEPTKEQVSPVTEKEKPELRKEKPSKTEKQIEKEIELEKAKQETGDKRLKEVERIEKLFDKGLITKKQFAAAFAKIYS